MVVLLITLSIFFCILIKVFIVVIIIYCRLILILHWPPLPAFHQVYQVAHRKSGKMQITGIHYNILGEKIHLYLCYFSAKHIVLRRKSKDLLAWNPDNVSEWGDMFRHGLLFQWASTIKIQLSILILYKVDLIISLKINLF